MRNILNVIKKECCTSCGICSNICPKQCIKTEYIPKDGIYRTVIDEKECIECGRCQKVCPVMTWNNSKNRYIGDYLGIYAGHNRDDVYRRNCASGGITTSLLAYMFRNGYIDSAIAAVRQEKSPLNSEVRLFSSEAEIMSSKGSVYSPTSFCNIISVIKESSFKKIAVVGLPCHIEAITNLCKYDKEVQRKIKFKLCLVCGHTPSNHAYRYVFKKIGVCAEEVLSMRNRGGGWPGFFTIETKCGNISLRHQSKYSWGQTLGSPLFTPSGCKHCSDPTGYNADISICDAWLNKYMADKMGVNLMIVRNKEINQLLMEMQKSALIALFPEDEEAFIQSNSNVLKEKIHINSVRNQQVKKKYGCYQNMEYVPLSIVSTIATHLLIATENLLGRVPWEKLNDSVMFMMKLIKYITLKCIQIKRY